MKKTLTFLFIICSVNLAMAQWVEQGTPAETTLRGIHFQNPDTGITVGSNGEVLQTLDGGLNWNKIDAGTTNTFGDAHMTNDSTGYAVGNAGTIIKTTDGGQSWTILNSGFSTILRGVHFINESVGYVCGQSQRIWQTVDAGANWTLQDDLGAYWLREIDFPTANIGYCVGDGGNIHKTTDGGVNWLAATSGPFVEQWDVKFPHPDTGYVCGTAGILIKTTDGGNNWIALNPGTSLNLYGLHFFDTKKGYITGAEGLILYTEDGGLTFTTEPSNVIMACVDIFMYTEYMGYISGQSGLVMKKCLPPTVGYTANVNELEISFTDTSTFGENHYWDFGDGNLSYDQNPQHTYTTTGTYDVQLIVENLCGTDTLTQTFIIQSSQLPEQDDHDDIIIYPNLNSGSFFISTGMQTDIGTICITDISGRQIISYELKQQGSNIEINGNFMPGIYLVHPMNKDGLRTLESRKIIVQ
jgi:photosystem II stability/assembly factor-like uncharacterized protein